ncbi:MAG: MFS transporter [Thermotogae bacterium]|nr:MAG: MFS transporter [Thermotogota bacterium]
MKNSVIPRDRQFYKFAAYGFLKNLRFFDPFIVLFFREMGMSFLQIGTLFSVREIATNLLEVPTGVVADAYGRRRSMIFSFLSYIASFTVFYFFPNFWFYVLAMVLYAFGEAFRSGTHKAMILEYLRIKGIEHLKVEYYGQTRGASQLGSAVSSLIAGALVFYAGSYKIVFLASIIPYVAELFLMISYPKELDGKIEKIGDRGWFNTFFANLRETVKSFTRVMRDWKVLKAMLNSAVYNAFHKSTKDYLQPVLEHTVVSVPLLLSLASRQRVAILAGLTYFLLYLLTSYASRNAHKVVKAARSLPRAINIAFLAGAILLLFAGTSVHWGVPVLAVASFVALYFIMNLKRPMMVAYISDMISHKVMATGLSVESQLRTLGTAILAPIVGFFADRFGVGGALVLASFVMIALWFPLRAD